jgi:hypothetical protein
VVLQTLAYLLPLMSQLQPWLHGKEVRGTHGRVSPLKEKKIPACGDAIRYLMGLCSFLLFVPLHP